MSCIVHSLEKNTLNTYIYRLYPEKDTLRYVFSIPISYRGKGEWEIHAWNSVYKLWPKDRAMPSFQDLLIWIYNELETREQHGKIYKLVSNIFSKLFKLDILPYFECFTATVEDDRLQIYGRLFRKFFRMVPLKNVSKEYNGVLLLGKYIKFEPLN